MQWIVLVTAEDGTEYAFGPFAEETEAEKVVQVYADINLHARTKLLTPWNLRIQSSP